MFSEVEKQTHPLAAASVGPLSSRHPVPMTSLYSPFFSETVGLEAPEDCGMQTRKEQTGQSRQCGGWHRQIRELRVVSTTQSYRLKAGRISSFSARKPE